MLRLTTTGLSRNYHLITIPLSMLSPLQYGMAIRRWLTKVSLMMVRITFILSTRSCVAYISSCRIKDSSIGGMHSTYLRRSLSWEVCSRPSWRLLINSIAISPEAMLLKSTARSSSVPNKESIRFLKILTILNQKIYSNMNSSEPISPSEKSCSAYGSCNLL